jgi:hypothetical protein
VTSLRWTKELPTKEGWYWAKFSALWLPDRDNGIVEVTETETVGVVWIDGQPMGLDMVVAWLGPLPEPEKPE